MNKIFLKFALLMAVATLQFGDAHANQCNTTKTSSSLSAVKERIVWGAAISPYVRSVLVTLYEKGIPFTHHKTLPSKILIAKNQPVDQNFSKISPFGKIPAYEEISMDNAIFSITESAVIIDYLNTTALGVSLRPSCPKANARVSFFVNFAGNNLATATHALLFENVIKPQELHEKSDLGRVATILGEELPAHLDFLEQTLADGRTWIANTEAISLADIAIVSHLATLDTSNLSAVKLIGDKRPNLLSYFNKVIARDSFKKALNF
jgi:glutathione S-transferase